MEDFSEVPQSGPSIFLKGGIRLHPVRDGVMPFEPELRRPITRDKGGNTLQDVMDPSTGMCLYATSPLMTHGEAVIQPTPYVPVKDPKRDAGILPQFDKATGTWYIGAGNSRRVIRTVDMGDSPLPNVPTRTGSNSAKNGATRAARALERASGPDANPNRPTRTQTFPRALIVAYINGMAKKKWKGKGQPPPFKITPYMIKMAKLELARQANIAEYCQND